MNRTAWIGVITAVVLISGCGDQTVPGRWFTAAQVDQGRTVFGDNCVQCHGDEAVGTPNWRQRDASGAFPPPPLNGTAHAWHHPYKQLQQTIENGSPRMPAFGDTLSDDQIEAVVAYFQSFWPDDIYQAWQRADQRQ